MGPGERWTPGDAGRTMWGETAPRTADSGLANLEAVIEAVYRALEEQGYDPARQLAGYLLSGDPAYITGHRGARALITRVERDQVLAELIRVYTAGALPPGGGQPR